MLGDASGYNQLVSSTPWFLWIVYLIIIIVLSIIALNLLISIIGDSYDKIIGIEENAKVYERLKLIMMYEAQSADEKHPYRKSGCLYFVTTPGFFESQGFLEQKIESDEGARIREKVDMIDAQIKKLLKLDGNSSRFDSLEEKMQRLMQKMEEIENKIK